MSTLLSRIDNSIATQRPQLTASLYAPRHLRPQQQPFTSFPAPCHRTNARQFVACAAATDKVAEIPDHLNATPHRRQVRQHFYQDAVGAMRAALDGGKTRMQLKCTIPELNVETDVYRIGTLLEMVREMATSLAMDGKRVKVCVQKAMGEGVFQGLPLTLSGVKRIMEAMDWGSCSDFVTLGAVAAEEVDDSDYYIMVAPQNVVGNTIMKPLLEMVNALEDKGKAIILVNPALKDIPSHSGIMGVRGRAERMDFASSFAVAYHFRLLFLPGSWYPIMGALRYAFGEDWQVFKRADTGRKEEMAQRSQHASHQSRSFLRIILTSGGDPQKKKEK